ncbi:MAG: hypothetical protein VXW65_07590 [Pseudomonadota bacterium]|nr:hypothetical protein [Pseudomonadota bacterium]
MSHYSLIESKPPVPDGISCKYFLLSEAQAKHGTILVASFKGTYPDGSLGNSHGAYIATAALYGVSAFDADCLILDFRELSYRWGNTLLMVFQDISQYKDGELEPDEIPFPIVVVTSDLSRDAFLSLVTPVGSAAPEWHFQDMDTAIEYAQRKIEEWFSY